MSSASSMGQTGTDITKLAFAVANTCALQFLLPGTVSVIATGAVGVGVIAPGSLVVGVSPPVMASTIQGFAMGMGLSGIGLPPLCLAVSTGICMNIPFLVLTGVSPGVGSGTGSAKVVGMNSSAFYSQLQMFMAASGLFGAYFSNISRAIAEGVCGNLNATAVMPMLAIVGPVGPAPAVSTFPAQFL